ncbi:efflux RND transporter periplasmic adaptor subunit [Alkalicaulis satelles]|uniref:Efflux RND transporter periplasmic adaptor subunit n=1 Tax=Alkalicaulis satelles TaxID=2609175 RepID=A0A5M6ZEZ9_9PROT|nr:efflux RND transporter periplasmic adaptor subunit [Alkalicaulis satelles]KAA5803309.1 efflux RND transporter periplasmic adaptor subunit [Alkalicaulis satelles]
MRRAVILILIVLAAVTGLWLWLTPSSSDLEYVTAHADQGPVRRAVDTTGRVVALETVIVGAQVSGLIEQVHVEVDDRVSAGQILAQFEAAPFELAVDLARAALERIEAQLAQTRAQLTAARAELERSQREFNRIEALAGRGVASASALDAARSDLIARQSERARLDAQSAGLAAELRQARAQLEQAQLNLQRATITAPISGVVVRRDVSPGQTVASSFQTPTLFTLTGDLERMRVEASVDEADIGAITPGLRVRFRVPAHRERWFEGEVRNVVAAPQEDGFLITYPVLITVANPDGVLLPGMTAQVEILADERDRVLRVPNAALLYTHDQSAAPRGGVSVSVVSREEAERLQSGQGRSRRVAALVDSGAPLVWVLSGPGQAPEPVEVEVGLRGQEHTEIIGGALNAGDRVVVGRRGG